MAIREIRKIGDPILRKVSKPVKNFDEKLHILLDDMRETLKKCEGLGLAAPQVGILKRVFIIEYVNEKTDEHIYIEAINPEIVSQKGSQTGSEGCLSVPEESYDVTRPKKVVLKAFDRFGNEFSLKGEDLMARAFCHEYDHLDGTLYVDKLEGEERERRYKEGFIED